MRIGLGLGIGFARVSSGQASPPKQWITNGSEVQQTPDGPTVVWSVNGSNVSYTEV